MAKTYSPEVIAELQQAIREADLHRPERIACYEAGEELAYDIQGVAPSNTGHMRVRIERFVGGGFAGQVYRVELLELTADGPIGHLTVGETYAIKILVPPSSGGQKFRDVLYAAGFQAPFSLQSNPAAARAGALWQTLFRRAARERFGTERAITEIHATFIDEKLGSCGEISEWIEGRVWRFEVDDDLAGRRQWRRGDSLDGQTSKEYLAKKQFMGDIVRLLHDMGAPELARQYEWWTCKSQPNCLKRLDAGDDPAAGLTAVDFRAGLSLLPMLPMSPRDVTLILEGLARGSLVQFDRGNLKTLQSFVDANAELFADMTDAVEELKAAETEYRRSQIDLTHNHLKLLNPARWGSILDATAKSWRIRNITDDGADRVLSKSRFAAGIFGLLGLLAPASLITGLVILISCLCRWSITWQEGVIGGALMLAGPPVVRFIRCLIGRSDLRKHYGSLLISPSYLRRAIRAHILDKVMAWHRAGRVDDRHARRLQRHPILFLLHWPLSLLPMPGLHRLLSDVRFGIGICQYILVRPVKLVLNSEMREEWMRQMLKDGRKRGMISDTEAAEIESQIKEPYVQKYLQSLAVHVCTLPISQVVALIVGIIYAWQQGLHFWYDFWEVWGIAVAAIAIVQIIPISPGSLVRGFYVVYRVIRDRNFKDYNIAVFMSFFKYIGYLAFPIQMAYRYPTLSRFMAGHWATGAVRLIPVFGEHGALPEHGVFDLFFNYSLTLRRRIRARTERRQSLRPRRWHVVPMAGLAVAAMTGVVWTFVSRDILPTQRTVWYATIMIPLLAGWLTAYLAGGARSSRRIVMGLLAGLLAGAVQGLVHVHLLANLADISFTDVAAKAFVRGISWRVFSFGVFATIGALLCETFAPEPKKVA
jgi:hypothetical protein